MFARVEGTHVINNKGCFTLDDRVLVVGKGSRVLPGEDSIDVADVGVVDVGSRASGGGGYIDGADEVERIADAMGLGEDAMACQTEGGDTSLTVLDPPTP
jgi:hypothetical protein